MHDWGTSRKAHVEGASRKNARSISETVGGQLHDRGTSRKAHDGGTLRKNATSMMAHDGGTLRRNATSVMAHDRGTQRKLEDGETSLKNAASPIDPAYDSMTS